MNKIIYISTEQTNLLRVKGRIVRKREQKM